MRWQNNLRTVICLGIACSAIFSSCRTKKTLVSTEFQFDSTRILRESSSQFSFQLQDTFRFFDLNISDSVPQKMIVRHRVAVASTRDSSETQRAAARQSRQTTIRSTQPQFDLAPYRVYVFIGILIFCICLLALLVRFLRL